MQEELAWAIMVLPPKGKGGYRVIWLVEVTCKVCKALFDCCLKQSVKLNNALHRFREGWVMGEATFEAKLAQHLAGLTHKPLFYVFLDVCKVYTSLDRGRCLELLRGYGLGPNLTRLLINYCK